MILLFCNIFVPKHTTAFAELVIFYKFALQTMNKAEMAYLNFQEAQAAGYIIGLVLAVALFALTFRRLHGVAKTSARILSMAVFFIAMHFGLQRLFRFHYYDPSLGYMVNLIFSMLGIYLLFIGLIYLLRQGRVMRRQWLPIAVVWLACVVLLATVRVWCTATHNSVSPGEQRIMLYADYLVAVALAVEVAYLYFTLRTTYLHLRLAVEEFTDQPASEMLGWVMASMRALALLFFYLPVATFFRSVGLVIFLYAFYITLAYMYMAFMFYSVSRDAIVASCAETISDELQHSSRPKGAYSMPREMISRQIGQWVRALLCQARHIYKGCGRRDRHRAARPAPMACRHRSGPLQSVAQ